jgi:hypothetical protein
MGLYKKTCGGNASAQGKRSEMEVGRIYVMHNNGD